FVLVKSFQISYTSLMGILKSVIVTGNSLGGLVASLVVLEILRRLYSSKTNLPLCITFGSPIVSSNGLQQVIYDQPILKSQFLHVVSVQDHIPFLFISNSSASDSQRYKPFGTYIMCSTSGCACFNTTDAVLKLLEAKGRSQLVNHNVDYGNILGYIEEFNILRLKEYGNILEDLKKSVTFFNGFSSMLPGLPGCSSLEVGIRLQMEAIEVIEAQEYNELVTSMADVEKQERLYLTDRENPELELNKAKINFAKLEWFKKKSWNTEAGGYYDCYKNCISSGSDEDTIKWNNSVTEYWKKKIEVIKQKPQYKGGVPLQTRYVRAATNYRRMVEPLDIADFYKIPGQKNYLKHRPKHYKQLQKWQEDDDERAENKIQKNLSSMRNKAVNLIEDSCFWAHVEDAMILTEMLNNKKEADCELEESVIKEDLKEFENYVMGLIRKFSVSEEIFLEKSTFMHWWREYYKIILEDGRSSPLIDYMEAKKYEPGSASRTRRDGNSTCVTYSCHMFFLLLVSFLALLIIYLFMREGSKKDSVGFVPT
ncbi:senescence-associated carboxylesterase 101-like, partial [Macadamia integrifolia]|uniref:senescence-associated carboxylesterase 101-like n=1 Tax=Macadamia integrifolia TaxID=60698 RepID=UPI001C5288FB